MNHKFFCYSTYGLSIIYLLKHVIHDWPLANWSLRFDISIAIISWLLVGYVFKLAFEKD